MFPMATPSAILYSRVRYSVTRVLRRDEMTERNHQETYGNSDPRDQPVIAMGTFETFGYILATIHLRITAGVITGAVVFFAMINRSTEHDPTGDFLMSADSLFYWRLIPFLAGAFD